MTFSITLQSGDHRFDCDADESVLEAALRAGIGLPYGCRNGACGSCKGRIVEGHVDRGTFQSKALTPAEQDAGHALLCCARPLSDLTVEVQVIAGTGDIPVRKLPCRVQSIQRAAPDVAIVSLQLPANERFLFLAGQYIDLLLKDGTRRSYSMAVPPGREGPIELHVRHMPGGRFTDMLFGVGPTVVKERDILRFEGPHGSFFLREDSRAPIVLLASGTGFAPIKSIVEHAQERGIDRLMTLYWGGRRPHDLYMDSLAREWAETIPGFHYVPVVSDALPEDGWTGRTGFVHQAVMDDLPDLSQHQVYACGAPVVIDSARRDFSARCGLPADAFFADAFTSAADSAA